MSIAKGLFHIQNLCHVIQIRTETLVLEGEAKDMICQAVEQMHVDLLVVGSRGLGKIKRYDTYIFFSFFFHFISEPLTKFVTPVSICLLLCVLEERLLGALAITVLITPTVPSLL